MKKLLVALTLAGWLVSSVVAQVIIQPNLFQNPLVLAENKDVQQDLKVSEEQVKKLVELSRDWNAAVKGLSFTTLDQEKRKNATAAALKGLADTLTGNQAKRLKQLELQQRDFGDPQIGKDLAITNEQRGGIITILQGFNPQWVKIIQGAKGNQQEIQKKLADVHRDFTANILNKLTPQQQAKWKDVAGPPFAGSFPSMAPVFVDMRPQPVLAWHMNDLNGALAEAKKTGKPIFVTFRCES
jgi:hypothetical protein